MQYSISPLLIWRAAGEVTEVADTAAGDSDGTHVSTSDVTVYGGY